MSNNPTAKFRVDISDLKKNIAEANRQIKLYRAEMQNASAGMQNGGETADSLSKKIEAQRKIVEAEKTKLQALKDELVRYEEKVEQGRGIVEDLTQRHQLAADAFGKDSDEAKALAEQLRKATDAQARNAAAAEELRTKIVNQDSAVKNAQGQVDTYTQQLGKLDDEQKHVNEDMQKTAEGGLNAFSVALGELVADILKDAVNGMKDLAESVVDVGKTFDTSMSKVKAISGASEEDTARLKAQAEELGRTTKFTAAQVADGMSYMAMAGWKTDQILAGIGPVLDLATASGEDLALTSDIVTDAMTAFGLKADDTQHFVDVLAQTAANSNTTVAMMGDTFRYAAPLAGAMGYSVEDVSLVLGTMASQGIKASQAGTSLRRVLSDLSSDFTVCGKEAGEMEIKVQNQDGSMRSLYDIVMDTRQAFSQLTEAERVNQAKTLVGQNAMSGFLALMSATDEDVQKLTASLDNAGGAAESMAGIMQDNLGGKIIEMDSAMDGFKKKVYEGMSEPLTELVVLITDRVVPELNAMADDFTAWLDEFQEENGDIADNVSAFLDKAIPAVREFLQWVKDNGPEIKSTLIGIVTAMAAFKGVTVIQSAVTAFQALAAVIELVGVKQAALNLIMAANPVGIIVAAVAGLAALLISLYKNNDEFREAVDTWGECLNETFEMWGEKFKEFYDTWKTGAKDIKDGWEDFWDSWETGANDIQKGTDDFWDSWQTGFDDIQTAAEKFWAWITDRYDDFTTGWDTIKDGWTEFKDNWAEGLQMILDLINSIIRAANKIPFVDLPEIGAVPEMARGGIVDRPTFAQIGEAGREAVIPLENNRGGIREIANLLRDEMRNGTGGGVQSAGSTSVTLTQNISSPKALSEYEIWRQTRNMLSLVKEQGV